MLSVLLRWAIPGPQQAGRATSLALTLFIYNQSNAKAEGPEALETTMDCNLNRAFRVVKDNSWPGNDHAGGRRPNPSSNAIMNTLNSTMPWQRLAALLLLAIAAINICTSAATVTVTKEQLTYTLNTSNQTASVKGLASNVTLVENLTIPESVSYEGVTYFVTKISDEAFKDKGAKITGNLLLPETLVAIGDHAFSKCANLTGELIIPSSVTTIDNYAFLECTGFTGILRLPENVALKTYAFGKCTGFSGLELPTNITFSSGYIFAGCSGMSGTLYISGSVKKIYADTFANCGFTSVIVGEGVADIITSCFYNCGNLQEIDLPSTLTHLGHQAFYRCPNLSSITVRAMTPPEPDRYDRYPYNLYDMNLPECVFYEADKYPNGKIFPYNSANLYLPEEAISTYKKAFEWKEFKNISPLDDSVAEIVLSDNNLTLHVAESHTLEYQILPSTAKHQSVSWSSSNVDIATVDSDGNITAVALGEATISATVANGMEASCNVSVVATPAEYISINHSKAALKATETIQLIATVIPETTTDKAVIWTSSNEDCATVNSNGLVTAMAPGTAVITAKCGSAETTCLISIIPNVILAESLRISPNEWSGVVGDELHIQVEILPQDVTEKTVAWSSSNEKIACVDPNGLVKMLSNGWCVITAATIDGSNLKDECFIISTSGISDVMTESDSCFDLYNIEGLLLKKNCEADHLKQLNTGIYILVVNGVSKKLIVN